MFMLASHVPCDFREFLFYSPQRRQIRSGSPRRHARMRALAFSAESYKTLPQARTDASRDYIIFFSSELGFNDSPRSITLRGA